MLRRSFIFLPGVRELTEKKIWDDGVPEWADFLNKEKAGPLKGNRKKIADLRIEEAMIKVEERDLGYFSTLFRTGDNWRRRCD